MQVCILANPFLLLILWCCKLTNPSLPTLFCFHPDNPLVITSNLCFISGPPLYILLICVCIRPSTLLAICSTFVSGPFFLCHLQSVFLSGPSSLCLHSLMCFFFNLTYLFSLYPRVYFRTIIFSTSLYCDSIYTIPSPTLSSVHIRTIIS